MYKSLCFHKLSYFYVLLNGVPITKGKTSRVISKKRGEFKEYLKEYTIKGKEKCVILVDESNSYFHHISCLIIYFEINDNEIIRVLSESKII